MSEDKRVAVIGMGGRGIGRTLPVTLELLEENTKLKTEIEQLKAEKVLDTTQLKKGLICLQEYKILCLEEEIVKLKAELEQSVKLLCEIETTIPCDDKIMGEWCNSNCGFSQTQPQCYKKYFELKGSTND